MLRVVLLLACDLPARRAAASASQRRTDGDSTSPRLVIKRHGLIDLLSL